MLRIMRAPNRPRSPEVKTVVRTSRPNVWIGVSLKWPGKRTVEEELAIVKHAPRFQAQHVPPGCGAEPYFICRFRARGSLPVATQGAAGGPRKHRFLQIAPFRSGGVLDWLRKV